MTTTPQMNITDFGGTAQVLGHTREFQYRAAKGRLIIGGLDQGEAKLVLAALMLGGAQNLVARTEEAPPTPAAGPAPAATAKPAPTAPPATAKPAAAPTPSATTPAAARKPSPPATAPKAEEKDSWGLAPPGVAGDKPATLPSPKAPVAEAPPAAPKAPKSAPAAAADVSKCDVGLLTGKTKLRDILSYLIRQGFAKPEQLVAACEALKGDVPVLARVSDLSERIPRTLDVMGFPDNMVE